METVLEAAGEAVVDDGYPTAVVLRYGGARYAVAMEHVAEVVPVPPVTRVPGVPAWLVGVVNWRGRVLPVVDPRLLLGGDTTPLPTSARLLVLAVDGVEVGLLAEAVAGLLEAGRTIPEPVPPTASPGAVTLVSGVVDDGSGPLALIDAAAVVGLREQLRTARRPA